MPIVDANDKSFEEVVHPDGKVHLNASSTRGGGGVGWKLFVEQFLARGV